MATEITLTLNGASTNYTLSTGARGPAGSDADVTQANITAAITDDEQFRSDIGAAATVHTHTVDAITPIASGKLIGRHGAGLGAAQEIGLDGGLEFQGANIRREALTGDVTASAGSNSTAIANDAVTNAKLANMATQTIKGRTSSGTGDPEDLTPAQARSVLELGTAALANTGTAADEVVLRGLNGSISTSLSGGTILTTGANGHIGTIDPTSYIQTRLTFRFFNGSQVTTLTANATGSDKVIDFPDRSGTVALTSGAQTISDAQTFSGAVAFTSTTRPTSSGTGTPASTSLITASDGDTRYGGPIYDLDGSASHSESTATTPVKTVVLPVGTYLIEFGKLQINHTDATSRTFTLLLNFSGGTANIQDRQIVFAPNQTNTAIHYNYSGQSTTLTQGGAITNASSAFGAGTFMFGGRIVVTSQTTLQIFGHCSVTPTNAVAYETSGILRKIA